MIVIEIIDPLPASTVAAANSSRTEDLAKAFKQLFIEKKEKHHRFESLLDLSFSLAQRFEMAITLHTLRYCLRDLQDCGLIKISPDPTLEPLV